jgi:hypothetical protein
LLKLKTNSMKKLITMVFILMMVAAFHSTAHSQNVRLNAYSFYTLDDAIEATDGYSYFNGTIKCTHILWGFGLEFNPVPDYGVELAYFRQDPNIEAVWYTGAVSGIPTNQTFLLGANYILLGGTRYLKIPRSPIEPYAGLMMGVGIMENKEPKPKAGVETSATKFAWQLKAGVNIMASKNIGFKLQAHLLSAVQSVGGELYGYGVSTNSSMLQFGVGGGLVFRFGK